MSGWQDAKRSFYARYEDGYSTPCCGVGIWGDIIENETLCPYCEQPFLFEEYEQEFIGGGEP